MGLEELKQEVLKKAEDKSKDLLDAARGEEKTIMKNAEDRAAAYRISVEEEAEKAIGMIEKRAKASTELEVKKMTLSAKKDITGEVFKEAKKRIAKFPEKKREQHINTLIERAKKEMDVGKIYCNKKDIKLIKGIHAEEGNVSGGIIAESADGRVSIDYSYETLLEAVKESTMQHIAKLLFK